MKKIDLTILSNVQYCLRNVLLPVLETGLDYIIAKNLSKLDSYMKAKQASLKELDEKYYFRKDKKVLLYAYTQKEDGSTVWKFDKDGNYILFDSSQTTPSMPRTDYNNPDFIKAVLALNDDVSFEFHKFPKEEVEELFKQGKFSGLDLSPLIGTLIEE